MMHRRILLIAWFVLALSLAGYLRAPGLANAQSGAPPAGPALADREQGPQSTSSQETRLFLPLIMKPCPTTAFNILTNGNFEAGPANWTQMSSHHQIINTTHAAKYDGSWSALLGGYDNANDVLYQTITVPEGCTAMKVVIHYRGVTQETGTGTYDKLYLSRQPVDQVTMAGHMFASNRSCNTCAWVRYSAIYNSMPSFGRTMRLYLQATTDYALPTSLTLDAISVEVQAGPFVIPTSAVASYAESGEVVGEDAELLPANE